MTGGVRAGLLSRGRSILDRRPHPTHRYARGVGIPRCRRTHARTYALRRDRRSPRASDRERVRPKMNGGEARRYEAGEQRDRAADRAKGNPAGRHTTRRLRALRRTMAALGRRRNVAMRSPLATSECTGRRHPTGQHPEAGWQHTTALRRGPEARFGAAMRRTLRSSTPPRRDFSGETVRKCLHSVSRDAVAGHAGPKMESTSTPVVLARRHGSSARHVVAVPPRMERFGNFGLELHPDKTRRQFGRFAVGNEGRADRRTFCALRTRCLSASRSRDLGARRHRHGEMAEGAELLCSPDQIYAVLSNATAVAQNSTPAGRKRTASAWARITTVAKTYWPKLEIRHPRINDRRPAMAQPKGGADALAGTACRNGR